MYYVFAVTTAGKLLTLQCASWPEVSIVLFNITGSPTIVHQLEFLEKGNQPDQAYIKKKFHITEEQFITYESNPSYYYPRHLREGFDAGRFRRIV